MIDYDRIVIWEEPDESGDVTRRVTVHWAVQNQRQSAELRGHTYVSDEVALEDFMVVHWAWFEA